MEDSIKRTVNLSLLFSVLFVLLISCNGQKKASMGPSTTTPSPLMMLVRDNYAGTDEEETLIIKDEKSLKAFFSKINRTRKPGIPVPTVDFTKELVLVYCSGKQKGGDMPKLSMLADKADTLVLGKKRVPESTNISATAVTSPFIVYKMPLTEKKITFRVME